MQIHVARNSSQLGVFSADEITAGLQSGRFLPSDLAWRDGMPNWTPLGDWSEFRHATPPPVSRAAAVSPDAPAPAGATTVPWEQGKSLPSFFATVKGAIFSPLETLASGRFAFGDHLLFCYLAILLTLPFQVAGLFLGRGQNAQIAELLQRTGVDAFVQAGNAMVNQPEPPVWVGLISLLFGLGLAPMFYAFAGVIHWVGQKMFRISVPLERTVAATLLCTALVIVFSAPLHLLRFNFIAYFAVVSLAMIPLFIVYYRALGAATGVSAWKQFWISTAVWFLICCCCGGAIGALAALAGLGRH